jgi:hypothetical protein
VARARKYNPEAFRKECMTAVKTVRDALSGASRAKYHLEAEHEVTIDFDFEVDGDNLTVLGGKAEVDVPVEVPADVGLDAELKRQTEHLADGSIRHHFKVSGRTT